MRKQGETLLKEEQWEESLTMNGEDFRFASIKGWKRNGLLVSKLTVILIIGIKLFMEWITMSSLTSTISLSLFQILDIYLQYLF